MCRRTNGGWMTTGQQFFDKELDAFLHLQSKAMARALIAVSENPDWHDLPVARAVGIMMANSRGTTNPNQCREAFCKMVREVGLEPIIKKPT